MRLHAAGCVYGIPPDVVRNLFALNDARHDRTGMDTHAAVYGLAFQKHAFFKIMTNIQSQMCDKRGVLFARCGKSGGYDIAIANCLDLRNAIFFHQLVKVGEYLA